MSLFSLSPCLSYSFSLKGHKRQEPSVSPSLFFTSFFGPAKRDVMLIDNLLNALPCFKGGRDMLLLRIQTKMRLSIRIISIRATMNHSLAVSFVANKPLLLSHIFIEPYGYVQECRFFVYIKSVKPKYQLSLFTAFEKSTGRQQHRVQPRRLRGHTSPRCPVLRGPRWRP